MLLIIILLAASIMSKTFQTLTEQEVNEIRSKIENLLPPPMSICFEKGLHLVRKPFDPDAYLSAYPNYHENMAKIETLSSINNLDSLIELKKYFMDLQRDYLIADPIGRSMLGFGAYRSYPLAFDHIIKLLDDRINEFASDSFKKPISFLEGEKVCGYSVDKYTKINFPYENYLKFKEIWNDETEMSFEDFYAAFKDTCCTDWYKMDRYGNCFGGYWEYPDNSEEKENAYELSGQDNCRALYELPYPKKFILYTIRLGCGSRLECVPFSVYVCEWMRRKIETMEQ